MFIKTILKDMATFFFWYIGGIVVPVLPLKVTYFLADIIGSIKYLVLKSKRELIIDEMSKTFGGKKNMIELKQIVKKGFKIMSKDRIEILLYPVLTKEMVERMVDIEGLDRLEQVSLSGRGVILLISHFGANKMIMPALGFKGHRINQIAGSPIAWGKATGQTSLMSRKALEFELEAEKNFPANFIYITNSIRPVIRCLKDNQIVCLAVDGAGGTKRVKTNFLNRVALLSPNFINLSKTTNSIVLPAFVIRQQNNKHKIVIEEPLNIEVDEGGNGELEYNTQKVSDILSRYFEKYPCHYAKKLLNTRLQVGKDPVPAFMDHESLIANRNFKEGGVVR